MSNYKRDLIVLLMFIAPIAVWSKTVNPLNYGILEAPNGIERYQKLLKCHKDALSEGRISYKGIKRIELEIPPNAQSIPLPIYTDFAGVEIVVKNQKKTIPLFVLSNDLKSVENIGGVNIDKGLYGNNKELAQGLNLVVVTDQNQWIINRKGYEYGVTRRDVFIVDDGKTIMQPISSYATMASSPKLEYCRVDSKKKVVKNLKFFRTEDSTEKTFLFKISNHYNLTVSNISITTPDNTDLYGDAAIQISNCVRVYLNNITINGTYSQKDKFGYGVSLGNIYDLKVKKMYARSKWGVFGNNYLNKVEIRDSDINRFDIHCYGKNIKAINCKFSEQYNQFSSVFGIVQFDKCIFTDFVPFLVESSFNAYTPFDLIWRNCTFNLSSNKNYLITLFGVPEPYNERYELRRKCLPNIIMKNCKVHLSDDVETWYLIKTDGVHYKDSFDYISNISIQGVSVNKDKEKDFRVSTDELNMTSPVKVTVDFK